MKNLIKQNVIAITGGIATGKTTVANFIKKQGWTVIDADQLARQVVAPGSKGLAAIVQEFGQDLINPDGSLDRAQLRLKVFGPHKDPSSQKKLEAITHPLIRELLVHQVEKEMANPSYHQPIFYEAALIFESGTQKDFREVWVTACHPNSQLQRLMERNRWPQDQAERFITAQFPMTKKMELADRIIWTEDPPDIYLPKLLPILSDLAENTPGKPQKFV